MAVVWIQMPGFNDSEETARAAAAELNDPRVRHFYDPHPTHRAGNAFADGLLAPGRGPAWDIYLFYARQTEWTEDKPPQPTTWMHQLSGGRRADPSRFHVGVDLERHLHAATHLVTGQACTAQ